MKPPPGLPSDTDPAAPPEPLRCATPSGGASSARPFLWSLAALAAAILILVIQQGPEIRRDPVGAARRRGSPTPTRPIENQPAPLKKRAQISRKVKSLSSNDDKTESVPGRPSRLRMAIEIMSAIALSAVRLRADEKG